jgi:hypothetical protein
MKSRGYTRQRKGIWFFVVLASVVGGIIFLELILRVTGLVDSNSEKTKHVYISPYGRSEGRPWTGHRPSNMNMKRVYPEFSFTLATNKEGLRDIERPVKKGIDEFRIVMLGDSFVEGAAAEYEQAIPHQIESSLNNKGLGWRLSVFNGGVGGHDPVLSYHLFTRVLRKYRPDITVLMINQTDLTDIVFRGGRDRFHPDGTAKINPYPSPRIEWWWRRFRTFRLIMMIGLGYDWTFLSPREQSVAKRASQEEILSVAANLKKLHDDDGSKFLMIVYPFGPHSMVLRTETTRSS